MPALRAFGLMAFIAAICAATPAVAQTQGLISGDERIGIDGRKVGLFQAGRNFDWDRPKPSEILENPAETKSERPYLRNVRPWRTEVKIEAQPPPESWTAKPNDYAAPVTVSRWAKPPAQQIVANPARGVGARPYLRSVGPGVALRQGDVVHYEGTAYDDKRPRKVTPVAGGASNAGGGGKPGAKDDPGAAGEKDDKPVAAGAKQKAAPSEEGQGAEGSPDKPNSGGGERRDVAARGGANRAGSEAAPQGQPSGSPDGALAGGAPGGSKDGSQAGAAGSSKDGDTGGKEDGAPDGGAGGPSGPGIREYLAGVQVASNEASRPIATAMLQMFAGIAPPPRAVPAAPAIEEKAVQSVPATTVTPSSPSPGATQSWWQAARSAVAAAWSNLWGSDKGKAVLTDLPPSARGDIR